MKKRRKTIPERLWRRWLDFMRRVLAPQLDEMGAIRTTRREDVEYECLRRAGLRYLQTGTEPDDDALREIVRACVVDAYAGHVPRRGGRRPETIPLHREDELCRKWERQIDGILIRYLDGRGCICSTPREDVRQECVREALVWYRRRRTPPPFSLLQLIVERRVLDIRRAYKRHQKPRHQKATVPLVRRPTGTPVSLEILLGQVPSREPAPAEAVVQRDQVRRFLDLLRQAMQTLWEKKPTQAQVLQICCLHYQRELSDAELTELLNADRDPEEPIWTCKRVQRERSRAIKSIRALMRTGDLTTFQGMLLLVVLGAAGVPQAAPSFSSALLLKVMAALVVVTGSACIPLVRNAPSPAEVHTEPKLLRTPVAAPPAPVAVRAGLSRPLEQEEAEGLGANVLGQLSPAWTHLFYASVWGVRLQHEDVSGEPTEEETQAADDGPQCCG